MRAFSELSDDQRWALAFYVGNLGTDPAQLARGGALWKQGTGLAELGNLKALTTLAPR